MSLKKNFLEWFGVITAIIYSLLVAANIGLEFFGFFLLFASAISIGIWAYIGSHKGILVLQFFYASAAILGMIRWFGKFNVLLTYQLKINKFYKVKFSKTLK